MHFAGWVGGLKIAGRRCSGCTLGNKSDCFCISTNCQKCKPLCTCTWSRLGRKWRRRKMRKNWVKVLKFNKSCKSFAYFFHLIYLCNKLHYSGCWLMTVWLKWCFCITKVTLVGPMQCNAMPAMQSAMRCNFKDATPSKPPKLMLQQHRKWSWSTLMQLLLLEAIWAAVPDRNIIVYKRYTNAIINALTSIIMNHNLWWLVGWIMVEYE